VEKTFREAVSRRLEKVFEKKENVKEIIPCTREEYLQMRYTLSPVFYRQLNEGILNN
jgi:hypothetical protein